MLWLHFQLWQRSSFWVVSHSQGGKILLVSLSVLGLGMLLLQARGPCGGEENNARAEVGREGEGRQVWGTGQWRSGESVDEDTEALPKGVGRRKGWVNSVCDAGDS